MHEEYDLCGRCGIADYMVEFDGDFAIHPQDKYCFYALSNEVKNLREQLTAVTQDANRYQLLRALLRHSRWNDVDAIHEMKPEFEKYINDNNLDTALDCVINFEMEK